MRKQQQARMKKKHAASQPFDKWEKERLAYKMCKEKQIYTGIGFAMRAEREGERESFQTGHRQAGAHTHTEKKMTTTKNVYCMHARKEICVAFSTFVCNVCISILRSTNFKVIYTMVMRTSVSQPIFNGRRHTKIQKLRQFHQITREKCTESERTTERQNERAKWGEKKRRKNRHKMKIATLGKFTTALKSYDINGINFIRFAWFYFMHTA